MFKIHALEAVYYVLQDLCDGDGLIQIGGAELARETGCPVEVVRAALVVLISANYVQKRPRLDARNGANTYAVAPPPPPAPPVPLDVVDADPDEDARFWQIVGGADA